MTRPFRAAPASPPPSGEEMAAVRNPVREACRRLLVGAVRGDALVFDIRLRSRDGTPFFGN